MTHALKSISVAIGDLTSHPANVRSNSPETYEPENIAHLTASIGVLGIIQPLLVQKIDGKFGVLAGGRRRAALKELVADKTAKGFTNKTKIECRLVPDDCDVTTALSLAENITQAPMNAIDEFEAFARMMEVDGQIARDDRQDLRHHGRRRERPVALWPDPSRHPRRGPRQDDHARYDEGLRGPSEPGRAA